MTCGFRRDTLSSRHTKQLGTLGGGNHFVELVYDEEDAFQNLLEKRWKNLDLHHES